MSPKQARALYRREKGKADRRGKQVTPTAQPFDPTVTYLYGGKHAPKLCPIAELPSYLRAARIEYEQALKEL